MGIVSTHVFVSGKANTADLTEVQGARDWDDGHKFINGNNGSVPLRDTSDSTYGSNWLQSVATGSVFASAGIGSLPTWSASPSLTSVTLTTMLTIGSNASVTGAIRLANGFAAGVWARNSANNADVALISADPTGSSNRVYIDSGVGGTEFGGSVLLGNAKSISAFNAAGNAAVPMFTFNASNIVVLGDTGSGGNLVGMTLNIGTGSFVFTNQSDAVFSVKVGGTTSSFPALKRDTIFLSLRLADDSGVTGAATGSLPAGASGRDGNIGFDTTINAFVYYVGGLRYKVAGVSF